MAKQTIVRVFSWDPDDPAAQAGWVDVDQSNARVICEYDDAAKTVTFGVAWLSPGLLWAGVNIRMGDGSIESTTLHAVGETLTRRYAADFYDRSSTFAIYVYTNGEPEPPPVGKVKVVIDVGIDPGGAADDGETFEVNGVQHLELELGVGESINVGLYASEKLWKFDSITRDNPLPVETRTSRNLTYLVGPYADGDTVHYIHFTAHYRANASIDVRFSPHPADHGAHDYLVIYYGVLASEQIRVEGSRTVRMWVGEGDQRGLEFLAAALPGKKLVRLEVGGVGYFPEPPDQYVTTGSLWFYDRELQPLVVKVFGGCDKLLYDKATGKLLDGETVTPKLVYCG